MKRILFLLCLLSCVILPQNLHASVFGYTWLQWDEYPEEIDVYGSTHVWGSYMEQYYYDFAAHGVLYANGQEVDWAYDGWSCEGATASVFHLGAPGTVYEFVGTYDLKIYFHDICYPWWFDIGYSPYVWNPFVASGSGSWEPYFPVCVEPVVLAGVATIYYVVTIDEQTLAQRRLTDGSLADVVTEWTRTVDGNFQVTLTAPGFDILLQLGLTSTGAIIRTIPCPFPSLPCAVINGAKVLVTVVASGAAILELWKIWSQRVLSPYGWPGDDGSVAPGPEWIWLPPESPPGSAEGNWHRPSTGESLHPDLNHGEPKGPHWDYKDPQGKWWDIWPDGTMTPKS